jgi:phospholipid/cholesterol/gamma-HCH transport system substrate-binding protein
MAKKNTPKILIGLFVVIGSVIGVGSVVWLGASKYFERGTPYVTYFDESVQGLNPDSSVKLRGVNIGRVERISVRPESAVVEVVMKLDAGKRLNAGLCAELKSAGLTGIVFIDLDLREKSDKLNPLPSESLSPYPVIPSRPSKTKQILDGIDDLVSKVNAINTGVIVRNLESATARLDRTLSSADRLLSDKRIDRILSSAKDTLSDARSTLSGVKTEIHDMKLKEISAQTQKLLDSLGKDTRKITADVRTTGENLREVSENLELLVERIQEDPSEILFGRRDTPRQ